MNISNIAQYIDKCCNSDSEFEQIAPMIVSCAKQVSDRFLINRESHVIIVSTIKIMIKNKSTKTQHKCLALKLLNECIINGKKPFHEYACNKIMSRLTILSLHQKDSSDYDKGKDIFGKQTDPKYGIEFLNSLLSYIPIWADTYKYSNETHKSAFQKAYLKLIEYKVQ